MKIPEDDANMIAEFITLGHIDDMLDRFRNPSAHKREWKKLHAEVKALAGLYAKTIEKMVAT